MLITNQLKNFRLIGYAKFNIISILQHSSLENLLKAQQVEFNGNWGENDFTGFELMTS